MKKSLLSIIVVTFNIDNIIKDVLESLNNIIYPNLELIIVDNGSTDNTVKFIKYKLSSIKKNLIMIKTYFLSKNIGLSKAYNFAVKKSSGEYLLFLDHDVFVKPSIVIELVNNINKSEKIGAVQPKVVNVLNKYVVYNKDLNKNFSEINMTLSSFKKSQIKFYPIGACFLTKKNIWYKVGGFNEDLFIEDIDVDYGWKLWLFGYCVLLNPNIEIYHMSNLLRKRQKTSIIFISNKYKSLIYIFIKNSGKINLIRFFFLLSLFTISKTTVSKYNIEKKELISQIIWIIKNIKYIIAKRKFIQSNRKTKDKEIDNMIKHYMLSTYVNLPMIRLREILRSRK